MASSLTNIEIETELRKVLKINLNHEQSSGNQNQNCTKEIQESSPENISNSQKASAEEVTGLTNLSFPKVNCGVEENVADNHTFRKPGMLSLSEIEDGVFGGRPNSNLPKKKKKNRKIAHDNKDKHLEKISAEDLSGTNVNSTARVENGEYEKHSVNHAISNNGGFESILSEKTIQNLPISTLSITDKLNLSQKTKKKRGKKNKSILEKQKTGKLNDSDLSNQLDRLINICNNPTSADPVIDKSHQHSNVSDCDKNKFCQPSITTLKNPLNATKALEELNLLKLNKSPDELSPEALHILRQQHIFPLKNSSKKQPKAKFLCHLCEYHCNSLVICKKHIESSKHFASVQEEILTMTLRQLPIACDNQLEALDRLLITIHQSQSLPDDELKVRLQISEKLTEFCKDRLPANCEIKLFGSSVSQLGLRGCDTNINLFVPSSSKSPPGCILKDVFTILSQHPEEFDEINSDYEAKLPSVQFRQTSSGIKCVVGINNSAALQTSELIRDYVSLDKRVKILCVALRYWARVCQIDRQAEGTLPPHTFDLMTIYFLQRQTPPVLPVLCDIENPQLDQKSIMAKWTIKNHMSVAYLWVELFRFYSLVFPASGNIISIRKSTSIPTSKKNWRNRIYSVEDPFMISRNLTRNVSSQNMNDFILNCFRMSFKYFGVPQLINGPLFDYIEAPLITEDDNVSSSCDKIKNVPKFSSIAVKEEVPEVENHTRDSVDDDGFDFANGENSDTDEDRDEEIDVAINRIRNLLGNHKQTTKNRDLEVSTKGENSEIMNSRSKSFQKHSLPTPIEILDLIRSVKTEDYVYNFPVKVFTGGKLPSIECSVCHKQGHMRKDCPEEKLPPLVVLPPMNPSFLNFISVACNEIYKLFSPSSTDIKVRDNLIFEIQSYIRTIYPTAAIELFGSSCNGFGFKNSDLDLCLTFKGNSTGEKINYVDVIVNLAEKFKQMKIFAMVIAIPTAKVPIVKFLHTKTRLECDISLYNTLAKYNTRMLSMYSKMDYRVRVLGYAMKYFAKLCDIGDASRGSLSSYAYTLMVLYFLQQRQPPVIPVLQELCEEGTQPGKLVVDGWNAWYYSNLDNIDKVWSQSGKNTETVGQLWLGLLRFYTEEFNFKENVICIRQHKILTRFEKLWNSKCIAIEDPFDLNHNLGSGVSSKMSCYIRKTFIRGREVFGTPMGAPPRNFQYMKDFLFDPRRLVEGPPPNDRGCRICGKIGHMVRECPRKKGNQRQQHKNNEKTRNTQEQKDKGRVDHAYKGAPLAKRPGPSNQQHLNVNVRPVEPARAMAPNFAPVAMMRPPLGWNPVPRPFIPPNLTARMPLPYMGANPLMNHLPGPFPQIRPAHPQSANIRVTLQGNVFHDHRINSTNENLTFKH